MTISDEPSQSMPATSALWQLLELSDKATPGPWNVSASGMFGDTGIIETRGEPGHNGIGIGQFYAHSPGGRANDAAFVVAAVNYVRSSPREGWIGWLTDERLAALTEIISSGRAYEAQSKSIASAIINYLIAHGPIASSCENTDAARLPQDGS